jgi:hypothetical protein
LKKGGIVEKRGEEETKSMPQVPVIPTLILCCIYQNFSKFENLGFSPKDLELKFK